MSTIPLKLQVLCEDGYKYVGFCKSKLVALGNIRRQSGMPAIRKAFYLPDNIMAIITSADLCDIITIMGESARGFLFHPRNGTIFQTTVTYDYQYNVTGAGWDFEGASLGEGSWAPTWILTDDDHGTRRITASKKSGNWKYESGKIPENYGNIDWKGVCEAGKEGDTPVLTWRGPMSRYWGCGEPSTYVYQNGEVLFQLFGYYNVYGAALTKDADGNMWQIAITAFGSVLKVFAQPYQSKEYLYQYDEENYPNGWRLLGEYTSSDTVTFSHFFFNASGTGANSVRTEEMITVNNVVYTKEKWHIFAVSVDINAKTATITKTSEENNGIQVTTQFYPGWDTNFWNTATDALASVGSIAQHDAYWTGETFLTDGTPIDFPTIGVGTRWYGWINQNCNCGKYFTDNFTDRVIAIDYKGDTKVQLTASQTRTRGSWKQVTTNQTITKTTTDTGYELTFVWTSNSKQQHKDDIDIKIKLNGIEYQSTKASFHYNTEYSENSSGNILTDEHTGTKSSSAEYLTDRDAVSIWFADLRNDILVSSRQKYIYKRTRSTSGDQTEPQVWGAYQDTGEVVVQDEVTEAVVNIVGDVITELPYYTNAQAFAYTFAGKYDGSILNEDYFNDPPEQDELDNSNDMASNRGKRFFLYRYDVPCSFAVDVYGNHFYSIIYKDNAYNYLTGDNPVALTDTPSPNQVFYPIAPL